jgi:Transposase DDE domain
LDPKLAENCKLRKEDFTRNRSFTFASLAVFIINFVKKSLQLELYSFADFLSIPSVSKQAFSQARKKLSPMIFILLNQKLLEEFYSDNIIKTFKGLRILAVDGSTLRLPADAALQEHYGPSQQNSSVPVARISTVFDVLNNVTLHGLIHDYWTSERSMVIEHFKELDQMNNEGQSFEDLYLFDRGYPALGLLFLLHETKKHFLMRIQEKFFSETTTVIKSGIRDSIVTISKSGKRTPLDSPFYEYLLDFPNDAKVQVRLLIFDLSEGKKEYIITSLLDQEKFTYEDIFQLYTMRWNIEECYKFHKNITDIENFSGKSQIAIEQDFHATIFACNISALLMLEAQEEVESEIQEKNQLKKSNSIQKAPKYRYKINRNILIGTIKNEIIDILLGDKDLDEYCERLKKRIKKNLIAIRPGRKFPRTYRSIRSTVDRRAL